MRSMACFRDSCALRRAAALRCALVLPIMELLSCFLVDGLGLIFGRRDADVVPAYVHSTAVAVPPGVDTWVSGAPSAAPLSAAQRGRHSRSLGSRYIGSGGSR